jgi:hypothetical protein
MTAAGDSMAPGSSDVPDVPVPASAADTADVTTPRPVLAALLLLGCTGVTEAKANEAEAAGSLPAACNDA